MTVHAYAAHSEHARLEPYAYDPGSLGPEEVDVAVTHCGICHTDAAMVDNEWGFSIYPVVPGHEVVGMVSAVGSNVDRTRLDVGRRVGVGALCGSCMRCEWCLSGRQHVCPQVVGTVMGGHRGGFATHVRVSNWQFAHAIPDAIASEHAGPLLCAGTTVFTPLLRYGVRPVDRVAVVGVGGLGHLALQYLAAWGCDVTAITSTPDKADQARGFGAAHVIATGGRNGRGTAELEQAAAQFDFILSTVSADLPWDRYVAALRPGGTLCVVGIPPHAVAVAPFGLIGGEKRVVGGQPGSLVETAQMLAFSARHGVTPAVELFPMAEADRALDHTRRGAARFRAVLVA